MGDVSHPVVGMDDEKVGGKSQEKMYKGTHGRPRKSLAVTLQGSETRGYPKMG